jgi:hypothetical protein
MKGRSVEKRTCGRIVYCHVLWYPGVVVNNAQGRQGEIECGRCEDEGVHQSWALLILL